MCQDCTADVVGQPRALGQAATVQESDQAHFFLGACYCEFEQYDKALSEFNMVSALDAHTDLGALTQRIAQRIATVQRLRQDPNSLLHRVRDPVMLNTWENPAEILAEVDLFDLEAGRAQVDTPTLTAFSKPEQGIHFLYPANWHITEQQSSREYYVHVSREEANGPGEFFKVGMSVTKYYRASTSENWISRSAPLYSMRRFVDLNGQDLQ